MLAPPALFRGLVEMRLRIPKQWQVFSQGKPGHRFQDRYHAQQRSRAHRGIFKRLWRLCLALGALAIGVVLAVIPGPAILFFFLAGALLAVDWLWMARLLDWLEVALRRWWKRSLAFWRNLSPVARVALVTFAGCIFVATGYGAYRLMR